ncbi:hypothetical protein PIB30_065070 [Stylosanthes scabra]|uniref:Uncharacterized protein n=1 Tax=Stylosanthes scabra TaxID=79078 RepID=A0ABU6XND8_9FABA|nr:hypothetical protein [Stylosanthes scabra]
MDSTCPLRILNGIVDSEKMQNACVLSFWLYSNFFKLGIAFLPSETHWPCLDEDGNYRFVIGIWNYHFRPRPRHPPHMVAECRGESADCGWRFGHSRLRLSISITSPKTNHLPIDVILIIAEVSSIWSGAITRTLIQILSTLPSVPVYGVKASKTFVSSRLFLFIVLLGTFFILSAGVPIHFIITIRQVRGKTLTTSSTKLKPVIPNPNHKLVISIFVETGPMSFTWEKGDSQFEEIRVKPETQKSKHKGICVRHLGYVTDTRSPFPPHHPFPSRPGLPNQRKGICVRRFKR